MDDQPIRDRSTGNGAGGHAAVFNQFGGLNHSAESGWVRPGQTVMLVGVQSVATARAGGLGKLGEAPCPPTPPDP
jgi:hypothetical protein